MKKVSYNALTKFLHWIIAGLIVTQFILAKLAERADDANQLVRQLGLLANHKSVGITILALAVLRVAWRFIKPPPPLPILMARWQVIASHISHWTLYGLLFAMPLTGWLMSSASAYSVSWFNLVQIPDLVGPDPALKEWFEEIHEVLAKVLLGVAGLHILAALKHAIIDRDGVMSRMTGIPGLLLFAAVIAVGATQLTSPGKKPIRATPNTAVTQPQPDATGKPAPNAPESGTENGPTLLPDSGAQGAQQPESITNNAVPANSATDDTQAQPLRPDTSAPPQPAPAQSAPAAELALWNIDHAASFIRFTGDQAGAAFTGEWTSWQAQIRFAGDRLESGSFAVTIDTARVNTRDAERDGILADAEWFDSAAHPQAFYRASRFRANADGSFVADGELIIKGVAAPVPLNFTVTGEGGQRVLEATSTSRLLLGNALLDRLALGVGTGEWEDTEWVGREVKVEVRVEASVDSP